MRGRGAFQIAQMKKVDKRIGLIFTNLRIILDTFEDIMLHPIKESPPPVSFPSLVKPHVSNHEGDNVKNDPLTVSVNQAVKLTGLGRSSFYKLLANKSISDIKIGNRRLILYKDLQKILSREDL